MYIYECVRVCFYVFVYTYVRTCARKVCASIRIYALLVPTYISSTSQQTRICTSAARRGRRFAHAREEANAAAVITRDNGKPTTTTNRSDDYNIYSVPVVVGSARARVCLASGR